MGLIPGLASTYQFPTRAVIATSVTLGIFLTVLVVAAALVATYRMKLKFRELEITRERLAATGLDGPAGVGNVTELNDMGAHRTVD